MPFYYLYIARWPDLLSMQESPTGRISSYMIGKAEGSGTEWHGHISAVTVCPEYRRLGLAKTLCREVERVSDKVYRGYFVDLFVRVTNTVAIKMYQKFGYTVYRRVLKYYDSDEDAFDMRKPCSRDTTGVIKPLPAPITVKELQPSR